jgi:hypothetical protein
MHTDSVRHGLRLKTYVTRCREAVGKDIDLWISLVPAPVAGRKCFDDGLKTIEWGFRRD